MVLVSNDIVLKVYHQIGFLARLVSASNALLRVGQWVRFSWTPGCCMSLSCVVKISCNYLIWWRSLLARGGFIIGVLCQAQEDIFVTLEFLAVSCFGFNHGRIKKQDLAYQLHSLGCMMGKTIHFDVSFWLLMIGD